MKRLNDKEDINAIVASLISQGLGDICTIVYPTLEESINKQIPIYDRKWYPFVNRLISVYVVDLARKSGIKAEFLNSSKRKEILSYLEEHKFVQAYRKDEIKKGVELYLDLKEEGKVSDRFSSKGLLQRVNPIGEIETLKGVLYLFQITLEETSIEEGFTGASTLLMSTKATEQDCNHPLGLDGILPLEKPSAIRFSLLNVKENLFNESGYQYKLLTDLLGINH